MGLGKCRGSRTANVPVRPPRPAPETWGKQDILRYAVAPATVALAVAAGLLLARIANVESLYLFLVPAVLASAGLGGLGPGLAATVLGLVLRARRGAFPDERE